MEAALHPVREPICRGQQGIGWQGQQNRHRSGDHDLDQGEAGIVPGLRATHSRRPTMVLRLSVVAVAVASGLGVPPEMT